MYKNEYFKSGFLNKKEIIIPKDWNIKKIKDVLLGTIGTTPSTKDPLNFIGNLEWINISDMNSHIIESNKRLNENNNSIKSRIISKNSLLYSFKLSIGKVGFNKNVAITNEAIISFDKEKNKNENLKYFYFILKKYLHLNAGVNIFGAKIMNKESIENAEILITDNKEEQNKIVSILEKQQKIIDLYIEKLSILKQQESYYQDELLSGRLRIKLNDSSIKEIIEKGWYHENDIIDGKEEEFEKWISEDFDKKIVFYKEENTIEKNIDNNIRSLSSEWIEKKLIDLSNITTGKLNANAKVDNGKYRFYTCAENHFFIDKYCFDTEAILISGNGSNVGHINYYKGKFNAYQRTYVLKDFSLSAIYIKKYLDNYLKLRINSEMRAANIPYIVFDTLSNMKIFIPPKNIEVLIINNFLNIFTNQRSLIEEKIEIEKEKMEYLTEELLSGKTRVE